MAKRGPKSGFNAQIQATIVQLVEAGKTEEEIAEIIGVCKTTLTNWKGKHKELLFAVRGARQLADNLVEASLFQTAVGWRGARPDTQAAMFWLRNRQPERWKEKTDGDVTINNNLNPAKLTDEQLDARIAAILAKGKK
jgi:hypothetical protein